MKRKLFFDSYIKRSNDPLNDTLIYDIEIIAEGNNSVFYLRTSDSDKSEIACLKNVYRYSELYSFLSRLNDEIYLLNRSCQKLVYSITKEKREELGLDDWYQDKKLQILSKKEKYDRSFNDYYIFKRNCSNNMDDPDTTRTYLIENRYCLKNHHPQCNPYEYDLDMISLKYEPDIDANDFLKLVYDKYRVLEIAYHNIKKKVMPIIIKDSIKGEQSILFEKHVCGEVTNKTSSIIDDIHYKISINTIKTFLNEYAAKKELLKKSNISAEEIETLANDISKEIYKYVSKQ